MSETNVIFIDLLYIIIINKNNRLAQGIQFVHIVGVDNVLAKLCDPLFVGFACLEKKPVSCKYVHKRSWNEKVGVHVYKGGKPTIVGRPIFNFL